MRIIAIALSTVALFGLTACGETRGERALTGGAIGAGTGAVGGAIIGGDPLGGALLGGAVGAGAGYLSDRDWRDDGRYDDRRRGRRYR